MNLPSWLEQGVHYFSGQVGSLFENDMCRNLLSTTRVSPSSRLSELGGHWASNARTSHLTHPSDTTYYAVQFAKQDTTRDLTDGCNGRTCRDTKCPSESLAGEACEARIDSRFWLKRHSNSIMQSQEITIDAWLWLKKTITSLCFDFVKLGLLNNSCGVLLRSFSCDTRNDITIDVAHNSREFYWYVCVA